MIVNYDRQIVLDTETTGLNNQGKIYLGHRIIEIGAVELINRKFTNNNFHVYINPNRSIQPDAFKIHGISNDFLLDKPTFGDIYKDFIKYINNSEIIIHNANFDVGFLNYELNKLNLKIKKISDICNIIDTLKIARSIFPGKKNSLDALCKRYKICINRKLHSAIQDAKILSKVYLRMTSMQKEIDFVSINNKNIYKIHSGHIHESQRKKSLFVYKLTNSEQNRHNRYLQKMNTIHPCLWIQ
ncbi:DNA polymerase III subunit epsilon [Buchnera aphidicola]|uniref:DNA polymerase III subunit epsilon n=1 Tax=Buchnera aphidicola (Stegophylla sp.) TaxID=2315800 RepID=A0A4D6YKH4_9GAMM|nr:DNA polymerase III subunit epsilon [Buchnera aphidicola (Stegophylla sp.)]QCI26340.1 DNA polymerase III subunit epsilon [Buchnera aphidicola (Stegophylla sp.)]